MNTKERLQDGLIKLGLLDPPVDGIWGSQSKASLKQFLQMGGRTPSSQPNEDNLNALETYSDPGIRLDDGIASKIVDYMIDEDWFVAREEGRYNIVYLEGVNADYSVNDDEPDKWNDLRLLISVNKGKPKVEGKWSATTEPGYYYTVKKWLDPQGAFRIAFGQQRAWRLGKHRQSHEALVQSRAVKGHRDIDKNFKRKGDPIVLGNFGINQHWGYDLPSIGTASAGCLVGQSVSGHKRFMALCKRDIRYQTSKGNLFFTTVIDGRKLLS